jgi:hypothetical protein
MQGHSHKVCFLILPVHNLNRTADRCLPHSSHSAKRSRSSKFHLRRILGAQASVFEAASLPDRKRIRRNGVTFRANDRRCSLI